MFVLYIIILIIFLIFCGGLWDAPWLPTRKQNFKRIANLIKKNNQPVFYDLGSGNGDLLFYLSREHNIKCVGIEVSPILYLYSKFKSFFDKNVAIRYGDFFNYNLEGADIVYCFIKSEAYPKLKEKMKKELKKETIIILSCWPFKKVKPFKVSKLEKSNTFYSYRKKDIDFS